MATRAYSGAVSRGAHYARRPAPPGVSEEHVRPDPEPDPFDPQPTPPAQQNGTVWADGSMALGQSNYPNLAQAPVSHWYAGQPSQPSNVPRDNRLQVHQDRMLLDHADTNYVPDTSRIYRHWSEGQSVEWTPGRPSQYAGVTLPDGPLAALANGTNAYDQTQQPNEVYAGGDPANVGRYRLGTELRVRGIYEQPLAKLGQDAYVHAYTGLQPQFPTEKPPMGVTAPYTPNSVGTASWAPAQPHQRISLFALPSETALSDFAGVQDAGLSDFREDERL